ncbi:MAG: leucyl/phenylalanyl-tRNA--protein transferase [Microthrixaceae bacterium]
MGADLPPSKWSFPSPIDAEPEGPVALGGDLDPSTLVEAYRGGLFPMPLGRSGELGWFSPDPRAVLPADAMHTSRTLRRSMRSMEISVDLAFREVMVACGDPRRPHGWITEDFVDAYTRLHQLGWAHSVEVWVDGELAGGVYGVAIGDFFAGESMFHRVTDASKAALVGLVELMQRCATPLIDVQWSTPHLASLGTIEIPRAQYLSVLAHSVEGRGPW